MSRRLWLSMALVVSSCFSAYAALPFADNFSASGPSAAWTEWFTTGGSLACVPGGTDGIAAPSGGDGYFGKSTFTAAAAASHGWVAGETADTNYTVQARLYLPVVNSATAPDDYWYQQIVFYRNGADYGQFHAHFNTNTTTLPNGPRFRVRIAQTGFKKAVEFTSPANFQHSEGWHTLKAVLNGTSGDFYYDNVLLGNVDWATEAAARNSGQFGFGQYLNGAGTRSIYVDQFSANITTGVEDWAQYE